MPQLKCKVFDLRKNSLLCPVATFKLFEKNYKVDLPSFGDVLEFFPPTFDAIDIELHPSRIQFIIRRISNIIE